MWNNKSKGSQDITMTEGDYGVQIPFIVKGLNVAPTDYAIKNGAFTSSSYQVDGHMTGRWWLRSPDCYYSSSVRDVNYYGSSDDYAYVNDSEGGVAPALRIRL